MEGMHGNPGSPHVQGEAGQPSKDWFQGLFRHFGQHSILRSRYTTAFIILPG